MSRTRRLKIVGEPAYYHVMSYTVSDEFYLGDIEKEKLFQIIRSFSKLYFVKVLTYCLMSNHFHLLIKMETGTELSNLELESRLRDFYGTNKEISSLDLALYRKKLADLSEYIKSIKETFSKWYNKLNKRRGYFWGERFKSLLIQDGKSLLSCMAYIDLNPIRANLVKLPEDYRWSGLGYRMGSKSVFLSFEGTGLSNQERYREIVYVLGGIDRSFEGKKGKISQKDIEKQELLGFSVSKKDLFLKRIRYFSDGLVIGSKLFIKEAYARFSNSVIFKKDRRAYDIELGGDIFSIKKLVK